MPKNWLPEKISPPPETAGEMCWISYPAQRLHMKRDWVLGLAWNVDLNTSWIPLSIPPLNFIGGSQIFDRGRLEVAYCHGGPRDFFQRGTSAPLAGGHAYSGFEISHHILSVNIKAKRRWFPYVVPKFRSSNSENRSRKKYAPPLKTGLENYLNHQWLWCANCSFASKRGARVQCP